MCLALSFAHKAETPDPLWSGVSFNCLVWVYHSESKIVLLAWRGWFCRQFALASVVKLALIDPGFWVCVYASEICVCRIASGKSVPTAGHTLGNRILALIAKIPRMVRFRRFPCASR